MIDYIGRIKSPHNKKLRMEQMAEISGELKDMAGRMACPVVALCQLNREFGNEKDRRPKLHHLRDSGAIEQDADVVALLHREHYYDTDADQTAAELIVAKNRNGRIGTIPLQWRGEIVWSRL